MNLKHPYESHLAEKLMHLPPPGDPDQNWQQMKTLLDNEMPRGGGGSSGSYRFWIAGAVIVAILVGTWFGGKQLLTKEHTKAVAGTIRTVNNKKAPTVASTDKNVGQPATKNKNLPGAAYPSAASTAEEAVVATDQKNDMAATSNAGNNKSVPEDKATVTISDNTRAATGLPTNPSNHTKTFPDRRNFYTADSKNDNRRTGRNYTNTGNNNRGANPVNKTSGGKNKPRSQKGNVEQSSLTYTPTILLPRRSLPSQPTNGSGLKESPVTYKINYTGSTIISPSGLVQREFTYYRFPDNATVKNKPARRKSNLFKTNEDKAFAIGLTLPMGFPIGDQEPLAYNSNGVANTISDYIPSPHFQYHFNHKTYVQAGFQFKAPQFINPLLLYQEHLIQPGMEQLTSITARKLYYFNLPFTIYHSPLKNFYMGTGLQYSSLLSGVAEHQIIKKQYLPGGQVMESVNNSIATFKNDFISNRLNNNEIRLLVDMSYYWSRFTVGLQYSQAFNNYVSIQVTPTSPYTFDKNKSLQFYLRYNIWEDKKRKQPQRQSLLTLK